MYHLIFTEKQITYYFILLIPGRKCTIARSTYQLRDLGREKKQKEIEFDGEGAAT